MNRSLTCGLLGAAFGLSAAAAPQQPIFRGGSDAVRVFVTVTDRDGRLVTTLARENFEVRDQGKPQPLTQFDNSPQPIRLMVMLDVSGSMEGNLPVLRDATSQLFTRFLPGDVARVGTFGRDITISPAFTHDANELSAALPTAIMPDAPTPLWLAIDQALDGFGDAAQTRKVILVLSDGKDTGPVHFRQRPGSQAGVIDRVLHGDRLVCGTDNPIAFAKLRDLLMMHFAVHKKWAAEVGEPQVVAIERYVIERLRKSLPDLAADWPSA